MQTIFPLLVGCTSLFRYEVVNSLQSHQAQFRYALPPSRVGCTSLFFYEVRTQTHADRLRPHTSTLVCHSESITQGCNSIGHTLSITERTQSSPTHSPTVSLDSPCLQRDRRLDCIGDQSSQDFLCARLPAYRSPALRVVPTCLCLRGRVVPYDLPFRATSVPTCPCLR